MGMTGGLCVGMTGGLCVGMTHGLAVGMTHGLAVGMTHGLPVENDTLPVIPECSYRESWIGCCDRPHFRK